MKPDAVIPGTFEFAARLGSEATAHQIQFQAHARRGDF